MKNERRITDNDRMTRIIAAQIPDNVLGLFGQNVNDLALTLIAPLESNQYRIHQGAIVNIFWATSGYLATNNNSS